MIRRLVFPLLCISASTFAHGQEAEPPAPAAEPQEEKAAEQLGEGNLGAQNAPAVEEMSPELDATIRKGLAALAEMQNNDGSFGRGRYGKHVGITALCALAFMADGNLPDRGKYGLEVRRALDFVIDNATETGLLAAETSHGPMYGHGFATLFLGEIYGMNPSDDRVRDALGRAVQLIIRSQNDEGGWRYNPVPYDADVSVTICEIMALRSARNAGIKIPRDTIDNAVDYVRRCQNSDGGFRYMSQSGGSAWPRTAAGVASLFYAGIYEDEAIERGLDYLVRTAMPGSGGGPGHAHFYYGHYYAVQAMYLAGGEWWSRWWPAMRSELIRRQASSGGWVDHQIGSAYATAMSLIILQMPKRYLPIFQK
ncbi:MAG: terpene cyclase/mutase family protein [Phycisphaerales bacterium]|nr:terpene cyclase/mutase family protein [Phycisphaerales bacterium]